ncbi:MAG: 16S rRNA (uracil(1498)-N(3))-methyltransferase [Bryobacterales bacterium]|nr:16S rRNA (uracil(1498)-N(3))-methyltransferase [Bryobacterales bacterium]
MARRLFFVDGVHSGKAEILGDEAGHLTKVLRVEKGQRYEISDNEHLYLGEVEVARREQVVFRILEKLETRELPLRVTLYASLIKFDHFEWMIEKATELGVERVTPVITERSEKGLDRAAGKRLERWRRIARESSQQSRRWRTPEVDVAIGFDAALSAPGVRYRLEESGAARPILQVLPVDRRAKDTVSVLVGPEGGWTEGERRASEEAGWVAVSLGPAVLRAETAAIAALAILSAAWQTAD